MDFNFYSLIPILSYSIKNNIILNIKDKPQLNEDEDQRRFKSDDD